MTLSQLGKTMARQKDQAVVPIGGGGAPPGGPSGDAYLLETGDYALLETGDFALLE